jgi:hypothetical protein
MRIPLTAPPDVQASTRELWAAIGDVGGSRNLDFHGHRIFNAGQAVDPFDYITLSDAKALIGRAALQTLRRAGRPQ